MAAAWGPTPAPGQCRSAPVAGTNVAQGPRRLNHSVTELAIDLACDWDAARLVLRGGAHSLRFNGSSNGPRRPLRLPHRLDVMR
jgi:hypothetical protein